VRLVYLLFYPYGGVRMSNYDFESMFKARRFKVVVPHVPYLPSDQVIQVSYQQIKDDGEFYKYIRLKAFPLDDLSYSYAEAVDVLEIFTSRWQHGRCDPWTEPYAKAVGDPEVTFTLTEFKNNKDADVLLEKFCKNRKRKDGLGGKMFAKTECEDAEDDLLD
jgi:hypothetical protein